jgi:hypothetical protein
MSRSAKHHAIPVFYLGGFADVTDPERIWVYRRRTGKTGGIVSEPRSPARELIKEVCSERGKYATTSFTGEVDHDSVELRLARRENEADDLLRRLRNGEEPIQPDKRRLAAYMTMLYRRGLNQEARRRETVRRAVQDNLNLDRLAFAAACEGDFRTAHELLQHPEKHQARFEQTMMSESLPISLENTEAYLCSMKWRFLTPAKGEFFITTDSPVYIPEIGLRHSQTGALFPISSELLLQASKYLDGEDLRFEPGGDMAYVFNVFQMRQAYGDVYARENAPWIIDQLRMLADEAARMAGNGPR